MKIIDIKFSGLFNLGFFIGFAFWVAFGVLFFLLSFVAPEALTINNESATGPADGFKGLILMIVIGGLISALVSATGAGLLRLISKKVSLGSIETDHTI